MRVYLDNCCYDRPFDDQSQLRVRLETEAKLAIQALMRIGALEYVWSDMLVTEAGDNPSQENCEKILSWRDRAAVYVSIDAEIERRAGEIMALGVKTADALHLACAETASCDWFFTVDRGILKKVSRLGSMRIANPMQFIQEDDT